jgi:beta-glucanase (GH16 family)
MKRHICYSQSQMGLFAKHLRVSKVPLNDSKLFCLIVILLPLPAILLPNILSGTLAAQSPGRGVQTRTPRPSSASGTPAVAPGTVDTGTQIPGWTLKFAEEFDGIALNYSKWSPHAPGKLILSGIQSWVPDAVEISGGQAHIVARRTSTGYTSGILTTFDTFAQTYGRFEIRFRIPAGRGLEPLFQLLPVPSGDTPSVDIMDAIGSEPANALFANHWGDARADRDYAGSYQVADLSVGFHIITVEWNEEEIAWSVDGIDRFHSFDGVPHQPLYLAVRLAVGTDKSGEPDNQTKFPAAFDVDYIRVFSRR